MIVQPFNPESAFRSASETSTPKRGYRLAGNLRAATAALTASSMLPSRFNCRCKGASNNADHVRDPSSVRRALGTRTAAPTRACARGNHTHTTEHASRRRVASWFVQSYHRSRSRTGRFVLARPRRPTRCGRSGDQSALRASICVRCSGRKRPSRQSERDRQSDDRPRAHMSSDIARARWNRVVSLVDGAPSQAR